MMLICPTWVYCDSGFQMSSDMSKRPAFVWFSVSSPNKIAKIMTVFKPISPNTPPVCHWSVKHIVPPQTHAIGWARSWHATFKFTFMHLADAFIQSDLHSIQVTVFTFFLSALAFPGNRTHDLGVASAMLYYLSYRKALHATRSNATNNLKI